VTAWGYNGLGCLGNGTTISSSKPIAVPLPAGVSAVAITAGSFHNLAITNDGVYTWGGGVLTAVKVLFPAAVTEVTDIAAGAGHSLAITDDGLYAWGGNSSGQLGDGTTTSRPDPVKVSFPPSVTAIFSVAAGSYHSLAVTDDGLYAWGSNGGAQLGDGTRINRAAPVKVALPGAVTAVTAIAGGGFHSLALTNDGVYAWGNNTFGQLGNGSITDSAVPVKVVFNSFKKTPPTALTAIAAGFWHSLAIGDGNIYGWGYGNNGELGSPAGSTNVFPVKAVFPKKIGPIVFTTVSAGDMHSLALSNAGEVYGFGNNSEGQLGTNTNGGPTPTKVAGEAAVVDVSAGYSHSLALH
jgi:alpha-tubulin suppressor-like RCC1 family protein